MINRLALPLLLALSTGAASAQAPAAGQAPPAQVRVPGVSAAGNAALTKLGSKVDPAGLAYAKEDAAFRQQLQALIASPAIDVDQLAAMMKRSQALAVRGRAIADEHLLTMVRVLPPADRAPFLRVVMGAVRPSAPPAK